MSTLLSNTIANETSIDAPSAARHAAPGVIEAWFGILGISREDVAVVYSDGFLSDETVISYVSGTVGSQNFSALVTFDETGAEVYGVSVAGHPVFDRPTLSDAFKAI